MQKIKLYLSNIFYNGMISRCLLKILLRINPTHFIFMFHRINDNEKGIFPGISVPIFTKQVEFLRKHFSFVALSQLINLIGKTNKPLAVITFDDGYKSTLINAFPILKKYNIPATVFLTTGPIAKEDIIWTDRLNLLKIKGMPISEERKEYFKKLPNAIKDVELNKLLSQSGLDCKSIPSEEKMLTWDDIKYMSKEGIEFGAHTVNHSILTNIDINEARKEIIDSKLEIESITGRLVETFCYPNGSVVDFNEDIKQILKESGFRCAVTTIEGRVNSYDDCFSLKRISLGNRYPNSAILKIIKEILKKK